MGMRARVKQYSIIVCTRKKKAKGRTKLEQEQIWNGFKGFRYSDGINYEKKSVGLLLDNPANKRQDAERVG